MFLFYLKKSVLKTVVVVRIKLQPLRFIHFFLSIFSLVLFIQTHLMEWIKFSSKTFFVLYEKNKNLYSQEGF